MPEAPEIACRSMEMNTSLVGKTIDYVDILQPKCLNLPPDDFRRALKNAYIENVTYHGKWIKVHTSKGWLMINLGMGGEILWTDRQKLPLKFRIIFDFTDCSCLVINFWWFGYVFYAGPEELNSIPMIAKLGPNILDLSEIDFERVLLSQKSKTRIKAVLLDQSKFAGIGNAYIHDILFLAKLHPNRLVSSLSALERADLFNAIQNGLIPSLKKGGAFYETNLYGQKGGFSMEDILIGYREGKPCPECGALIEKIRTGNTTSYICPNCQSQVVS